MDVKFNEIISILADFAHSTTDSESEAKSIAVRAGRCGSPFTYSVIELAPQHFAVVSHIEAPLYRAIIRAGEAAR